MKIRPAFALLIGSFIFGILGCTSSEDLVKKLISSNPNIREPALNRLPTISERKAKELVPLLIIKLQESDNQVVDRAQSALVQIGPPAVKDLTDALHDPDIFVRMSAAEALGQIGPPALSSIPALIETAEGNHPLVREDAILALAAINLDDEGVQKVLKSALKDPNEDVRATAQNLLKKPAPPVNPS